MSQGDDDNEEPEETIDELRRRLPPSVWTTLTGLPKHRDDEHHTNNKNNNNVDYFAVSRLVQAQLNQTEHHKAMELCGKFLYSTLQRAVQVHDMGQSTFVATGDIDDMWTRVSDFIVCRRRCCDFLQVEVLFMYVPILVSIGPLLTTVLSGWFCFSSLRMWVPIGFGSANWTLHGPNDNFFLVDIIVNDNLKYNNEYNCSHSHTRTTMVANYCGRCHSTASL